MAWGLVEKRLQDVPEIVSVLLTCSIVRRTQKEQQESAPVQPVHSRGLTEAHRAIGRTKGEEMKTRDHTSIHALKALVLSNAAQHQATPKFHGLEAFSSASTWSNW